LDSCVDVIRKNSEKAFKQELMYAMHVNSPAVHVTLKGLNCVNLARCINEHIIQGFSHVFWVQVPLKSSQDQCDDLIDTSLDLPDVSSANINEDLATHDTWQWWNRLRTLCDSNKRVGVVLELTADLPSETAILLWLGEPIKAVVVPTNIFLTNKKGFPVLSRAHQNLVRQLFKLDVQLVLSGKERHVDKGIRAYQMYLDHLYKNQEPPDNISQFAKGYEDYLQCPLQPLMDNLESHTYEVFEKDPVKYSEYQKAVYCALRDRVSDTDRDTHVTVIMVLGAGRGPLVTASIKAAQQALRQIRVYAVEKNPNAVVTLENMKQDFWGDLVTIVSCDMRHWSAPEKADIIVSELLGSFGDNELSPECLDGAQRFLKDDGISIPCLYTSYVSPLSSSKLWNEARLCRDQTKPPEAPYETPYVVRLHNSRQLAEAQPLFSFRHPNTDPVMDNSRYGSLQFDIDLDTVLHGFAGYFHCVLYGDIVLSIVPHMHTAGMFSWFPIYFPIKDPLYVHQGDKLVVHFWRLTNSKNVWYEWCITDPVTRPLHNPKGRSYTIGL
jgi:protein arginine N-methyltransferase 5